MTFRRRRILAALLPIAFLATPLRADDAEAVRALVHRADALCAGLQRVAYRAVVRIERRDAEAQEETFGVWIRRWPAEPSLPAPNPDAGGMMPAMALRPAHRVASTLRADLRVERGDGGILVVDGDDAWSLDPGERRIVRHPLAIGGEELVASFGAEVAVRTPFLPTERLADEIAAARTTRLGDATEIDGAACVEVIFESRLEGRPMRGRWRLDAATGLLRGWRFESEGVAIEVALHDLVLDPPLPSSTFALDRAGEGFTRQDVAPPAPRVPIAPGLDAPSWRLATPEGEELALESLRGRVVVIDFWGSWCGPCRAAMPAIQRLHERWGGRGVAVVGIACRERDAAAPVAVMRDLGCTYRLLLEGDEVARAYGVPGYPTLVLVDRAGRVAASHVGFDPELEARLDARIAELLAAP